MMIAVSLTNATLTLYRKKKRIKLVTINYYIQTLKIAEVCKWMHILLIIISIKLIHFHNMHFCVLAHHSYLRLVHPNTEVYG